eukprot:365122-Chlamydomonas_euryale.AAC.14
MTRLRPCDWNGSLGNLLCSRNLTASGHRTAPIMLSKRAYASASKVRSSSVLRKTEREYELKNRSCSSMIVPDIRTAQSIYSFLGGVQADGGDAFPFSINELNKRGL